LNNELLQGPDLTNQLVGVLTRFRHEAIAIVGDIESMFYQVHVPPAQQDYLRFVWWPNGDFDQELQDYQMCVHLFGGIHSLSAANYALKRTASDYEHLHGSDAAETVRHNFYVDDMLNSCPTEKAAIQLLSSVSLMCQDGGFHLTKFKSNNRMVLQSIPVSVRAKSVKQIDLGADNLPTDRALITHWCIESDQFGFSIKLPIKPPTHRGILSLILWVPHHRSFFFEESSFNKYVVRKLNGMKTYHRSNMIFGISGKLN